MPSGRVYSFMAQRIHGDLFLSGKTIPADYKSMARRMVVTARRLRVVEERSFREVTHQGRHAIEVELDRPDGGLSIVGRIIDVEETREVYVLQVSTRNPDDRLRSTDAKVRAFFDKSEIPPGQGKP